MTIKRSVWSYAMRITAAFLLCMSFVATASAITLGIHKTLADSSVTTSKVLASESASAWGGNYTTSGGTLNVIIQTDSGSSTWKNAATAKVEPGENGSTKLTLNQSLYVRGKLSGIGAVGDGTFTMN